MQTLQSLLTKSRLFFVAWCIVAAFGTYFTMYAFRKPFTTGTYESYFLFGIHYKIILIIAQVIGYMLSKFAGIKIISELRSSSRQKLIIGLIVFAEIALIFFGLVPAPYNLIFLFLNGLPLGMIWGIVFSYLEGRKFTELLGMGLSVSLIVSSGFLKTIYFGIHEVFPGITEFWMPALIGIVFLPVFLFFSWMLSVIPAPTEEDKRIRVERKPMTNGDKLTVLKKYGWGLLGFVLIYIMLATMRDFRDNFSVEIWNEIDPGWDKTIFSKTETFSGLVVLAAIGCLSLIKSNLKGFLVTQCLIVFGFLLCGFVTLLFGMHLVNAFTWMLLLGTGMFLGYIPIQVALFERMIAVFKIKANAGFFVYICDSLGYLGSLALLLYKEFYMKEQSWSHVLIKFSYMLSVVGLIFMITSFLFFWRKASNKSFNRISQHPALV